MFFHCWVLTLVCILLIFNEFSNPEMPFVSFFLESPWILLLPGTKLCLYGNVQRFRSLFSSCSLDLLPHTLKINCFNLQMLILVVLRLKLGSYRMIDAVFKLVHSCSFNKLKIALSWNLLAFFISKIPNGYLAFWEWR